MLDKNKAIARESVQRPKYGPRNTYIFQCSYLGCTEKIRVRADSLNKSSGMCKVHSHIKRPFESIYQGLFKDWRKVSVELTYEEFLDFTKINECHYCGEKIIRYPYATIKGEYLSRAYYLDRKENSLGYSKDNCVVCCTDCNIMRGNRFSYEEFVEIGNAIRTVKEARVTS